MGHHWGGGLDHPLQSKRGKGGHPSPLRNGMSKIIIFGTGFWNQTVFFYNNFQRWPNISRIWGSIWQNFKYSEKSMQSPGEGKSDIHGGFQHASTGLTSNWHSTLTRMNVQWAQPMQHTPAPTDPPPLYIHTYSISIICLLPSLG